MCVWLFLDYYSDNQVLFKESFLMCSLKNWVSFWEAAVEWWAITGWLWVKCRNALFKRAFFFFTFTSTDRKYLLLCLSTHTTYDTRVLQSLRPCKCAVVFIFQRRGRSPLITECVMALPAAESAQCCVLRLVHVLDAKTVTFLWGYILITFDLIAKMSAWWKLGQTQAILVISRSSLLELYPVKNIQMILLHNFTILSFSYLIVI